MDYYYSDYGGRGRSVITSVVRRREMNEGRKAVFVGDEDDGREEAVTAKDAEDGLPRSRFDPVLQARVSCFDERTDRDRRCRRVPFSVAPFDSSSSPPPSLSLLSFSFSCHRFEIFPTILAATPRSFSAVAHEYDKDFKSVAYLFSLQLSRALIFPTTISAVSPVVLTFCPRSLAAPRRAQ